MLGFVDATLSEIPEAQAYINSHNLTAYSAGVADWDVRRRFSVTIWQMLSALSAGTFTQIGAE